LEDWQVERWGERLLLKRGFHLILFQGTASRLHHLVICLVMQVAFLEGMQKGSKFHQESPYQFRKYMERKFKKYKVYGSDKKSWFKSLFKKK
jgi:hypothetical protein